MAEKKPPEPKSEAVPETGAASEIDSLPVSPVDEGLSFGDIELPGESRKETEPLLALDPEGVLMTGRATHSSNRRRHGARKWLKRILIGASAAVVLLLLAVAGTLYFAGAWAVERAWPMVDRSLSKKGIYLSWDSVEQTRERGIVLENVIIFKDAARSEPLLTVGNVAAALVWGHEKIGGGPGAAMTLDQSGLLLDTGAVRNQLTGLQGSLTANSAGLVVDQLVGELNGLRLDVAGDLKWSSLPAGQKNGEQGGGDRADKKGDRERERDGKKPGKIDLASMDFAPIDQALDWIRFSGKGAPLLLEARFSEAEGQPLGIDVSLKGADFTWRDVPLDIVDLGIHGELSGDEKAPIRISPLLLEYRGGTLNGEAIYQMGKQRVVISSLDSNLDLAGLAAELHPPTGEKLKAWKFAGPPEIGLKGTLALKNFAASVVDGEVTLPQGLIADFGLSEPLAVSRFHTTISMNEGTVSTGDFQVDLPGGKIDAELEAKPFVEPMEFGGQFTMAEHAVQAIARLFGVKEPVDDVVSLAGTFSGTPSRIEVSALKMDQGDRSITAEAAVDLDARLVEMKSLKSNFDLLGLAARVHPLAAKSLAPIRVPVPPEFDLSGTISLADVSKSAFMGTLTLPGGVIIGPDTSAPIEITEFYSEFAIQDHEVVAKQFHLKVFEGAVDGVVTSNPFAEPRQFAGTINASQLSLASISRIFSTASAAPEPVATAVEAAVEAAADLVETAVEETAETPVASPPAEEKSDLNLGNVVGAVQDAAENAVTQTVDAVASVATPGDPAEEVVAEGSEIAAPGSDRIDLTVEFQGTPSRIEIPALKFDRGERSLRTRANIDVENGVLEIGSLDSNLDLVALAKAAHPPSRESLKSIEFGGGPVIQMNGTLPWKQLQQANVAGSVKIPEGLTVTLSEARQLQIDDFSSTFKLENGNFTTDDLRVQALGGVTLARVIARPFEENLPLGIAVQSKGLLLTEISRISGAEKKMPGTADFTLQGNGLATLTGFNGKGKIDVKDTEFYFIPIIGKLLDKLNSLNLGLKEDEKSNLSANFAISEGVIDSPDLNIQLANLDVDAPGWVDLGKEYVDMDIRVRPGGMLGSANRLSGFALEVSAKGPYDQISYDFVGGAAETALGIVDNVTGGALESLNGMVKPLTNSEGTTQPEGNPGSGTPPPPPTDGKKGLLKKLKLFQKK